MVKKDWEKSNKVKKKFKEVRWDNKKGAESISVVFDGDKWRVWIHDVFGYDEELQPLGFNDRQSAINFAEGYMENN